MPRDARIALAALVLLWHAGCRPAADLEVEVDAAPPVQTEAELTLVTYSQWQEVLGRHSGEIVVVDLWATWCLPCLERFPEVVELHRRFAPRGVIFLTLSLDDREDADAVAEARSFLAEQGATFDHYLMDESMPTAFERLDLLSIPAVFIYGTNGKIAHRLTADDPNAQFTSADVARSIHQLLDRS